MTHLNKYSLQMCFEATVRESNGYTSRSEHHSSCKNMNKSINTEHGLSQSNNLISFFQALKMTTYG